VGAVQLANLAVMRCRPQVVREMQPLIEHVTCRVGVSIVVRYNMWCIASTAGMEAA
jgi:hypothetical protein